MRGRGMLKQLFLHRVLAEPGDRAQPPGDRRPRAAAAFQVTGEAFDISPARLGCQPGPERRVGAAAVP
jgi:hypothetical protein